MIATRIRGRVGAGGTSAPRSRSLPAQMSAWRRSLAAIRRNAAGAARILLDRGEGVVQQDRVALEAQVVQALGRIGGHARMLPAR